LKCTIYKQKQGVRGLEIDLLPEEIKQVLHISDSVEFKFLCFNSGAFPMDLNRITTLSVFRSCFAVVEVDTDDASGTLGLGVSLVEYF